MPVICIWRLESRSPQHVVAEYFASDNELRVRAHSALAMDIDQRALASLRLPTETSLPQPIVGWHPLLLLEVGSFAAKR